MKRKTLIASALVAALGIGAAAALPAIAHGPGWGKGSGGCMMGQGAGYGCMKGQGMGSGNQGNCARFGPQTQGEPLTLDDVTAQFEQRLAWRGNPNVKLGPVVQKDDKTITVDIVTKDDSLVRRIEVDMATGRHSPVR